MQPKLTRAQAKAALIQKNTENLRKMVSDSVSAIRSQGTGCYIKDYGVDYVDTKTKYRDTIGLLVPFYSNGKLKRHYGLISEEAQKPIVQIIKKTYHIDINYPTEYNRFIRLLQELQYAHDEAFDDGKNDMEKFINRTDKLMENLC